ncbi:carbohydrate ABC transporter permease [Ktedonosporobacter rubrisoli]|uniref:Carbohydrate ABC transporter permease n=1 Tax=Ktedonosporobacter rubrisoli TaxID=2509675 RepID=A0A4P6JS65_KTERU|nr:carbohydrate ABC transporter permease [Ktedonosporobacter rubrisoli]QBD78347.1 carbohydrate ABC transporter permease [Ktedonosporobacter rubrisoli]
MATLGKHQEPAGTLSLTGLSESRRRSYVRGRFYQHMSMLWTYIVLIGVSLFLLAPFLWLLSASLKTVGQYYQTPIQWIPQPVKWSNYLEVFTTYRFAHYIFNSIWLAAFCVATSTFVSALVAYGFARFRFPGRTLWFIIVLATMMIPSQILTLALYMTFKNLGWINTFLPIIVPKLCGDAFSIFLFRQFFMGLSHELDEAARLDGCGSFGIFWRIILPQSKPVLIVVAILTFLASWRDAWGPLIYLSSDSNYTVPLGLLNFTSPVKQVYPQLMAATLIALVVPVVLYALGQRYIDSGVAIAEIK